MASGGPRKLFEDIHRAGKLIYEFPVARLPKVEVTSLLRIGDRVSPKKYLATQNKDHLL